MLDLFSTKAAAAASSANGTVPKGVGGGSVMLSLTRILDNPYQPRGHYDAEHILNLAKSIKALKHELPATRGLQQLPMARVGVMGDSGFDMAARHMYANGQALALLGQAAGVAQLMFGHSRLRAFMVISEGIEALGGGSAIGMNFAGIDDIEGRYGALMDPDPDYAEMPIAIGFALDHQMWAHSVTENSQRKNITAIEEAQSLQRAIDEFGLTTAEAGQPFGYARSTTANKLRLLQLPDEAQRAIAVGKLTERHGRELLRLSDSPERLASALGMAMERDMTVAQLASVIEVHLSYEKAGFSIGTRIEPAAPAAPRDKSDGQPAPADSLIDAIRSGKAERLNLPEFEQFIVSAWWLLDTAHEAFVDLVRAYRPALAAALASTLEH